jgi:hypothetical protein
MRTNQRPVSGGLFVEFWAQYVALLKLAHELYGPFLGFVMFAAFLVSNGLGECSADVAAI